MGMEELTGAGGTVEVQGQTLTLNKLTGNDMGKLEAFLKERQPRPMARYVEEVRQLQPLREMDPDLYREQCDRLLLQAHEEMKQGLSNNDVLGAQDNIDAIAYTLWLMARVNHPTLSFEWLREAVSGEDLEKMQKKIDFANRAWLSKAEAGKNGPLPKAPAPA